MYPEEFTDGFGNQSTNLAEDFQKRKAAGVMGGTFRPIQSGLPIAQYQAFVNNEVKAQAEAAETNGFGTAVMNGLKSGVRGLLGAAKAGVDYNIALHQKNDQNYRPVNDWAFGISDSLQSGIDSLQREEIKADSTAGQLMYDLTEGAVQLAIQAGVTLATGGTGGAIYMGANIAGDQYLDLRKEGVDVERAAQAGLINAPFQAMLERAGMAKILAKIPAGQGLKKKLGEVLKAGFEEGITEGLQELPEQFTSIWAKDKNATPESMAAKWGENWEQNVKEVGYSALIGGILGGGAKGLHIVTDSVRRNIGEKVNEVKKEQLVNQAERVGKSGVNLEYAAAAIDANSQGETISVEAKDVKAFMQQTNGEKLAERLGVTVEQIEEAANLGQDIDISRGEYVAAMSENKGFYEATQGGMYFGVDGELAANARENLKTLKNDMHFTEEITAQLDTELDAIVDSATKAGMNKSHAGNLRLVLEARALAIEPENPAAWLQKNKLRFEDGGKGAAGRKQRGWTQKVWGKPGNGERYKGTVQDYKQAQLEVINQNNKMQDDYHTGIRSVNDILTAKEALDLTQEQLDNYEKEGYSYPDFTLQDGKTAIASGYITVYSSKEIKPGVFVTPSKMMAADYAGDGTIYSKRIPVKDMAFINADEGNYAPVKQYLQKTDADTKGMFSLAEDGSYIITLFKGADASTVIHETGHYFVETMINEALADPSNTRLVRDAKILLEYGGMTMEQWQNASIDEKRAAHEKFAEAFETYLIEGKSPSVGLRGVFQRFSKWLTAIYSKIARSENAAELNNDVRGVFDRMLASQEEIEMQTQLNGILGELPAELTSKLDDKAKNTLQDKIMGARDKAVDILTKKMMQDFNARRKAEKAAYIKEITPKVEEVIHSQRVNQAREQVGYWFGKESKTNYPAFKNINGMAHANAPVKHWTVTNASIIARKYRHAIGSVLPNYNDVLQDTKAALNDILNPTIEGLEVGIKEYNEHLADVWAQSGDKKGYWTYEGEGNGVYEHGQTVDPAIINSYAENGKIDERAKEMIAADGYVFHSAEEELEGSNWYVNYVAEHGRKKVSRKELERIASEIVSGTDKYRYYIGEIYNSPDFQEYASDTKKQLDELTKLKNELETNPEKVDLVKMAKRSALSDEQRQQFEMIAEQTGYSSGDEMAQDILNNPSERQMVRQLIDEAVQKRFPDIYKERELAEQAAREALYNDESGEVIALEHELIAGYLDDALSNTAYKQRAKAFAQIAKVKAKEIISTMSVGDIIKGNGRRFMLAERRAAANAAKAIKDGDLVMAEYNKQQQLINHELCRQALQIRGKVESAQRFIRKMARMKKENFGTEQHFNQIASLLERMGISRHGYDRESDNQLLASYVEEMKTKCGAIVDVPEFVLNESNDLSNAMNLSFDHYEDVVNALKNIYAIAKYDTKMGKINDSNSFEDTKAEIMEALKKHDITYVPQVGTPQYTRWQKFKDWSKAHWQANRNADNFYLSLDGWTEGWFTKNFYRPITSCADDEATMQMQLQQEYEAAYKEWAPTKEDRNAAGTKRYYEELGASMSKDELIQLVCNLGNDGNWHRLCETAPEGMQNSEIWVSESELVTREQAAEQTRQNLVQFLNKYLTAADVKYAQAKIDACNRLWPRLREVNLKTKGFAPKEVEATPTVFTLANGETICLHGGYFPLVRDTQMGSAPAGQNRIASTDESFVSAINTMTTASGSSQARTRAKYPVSLVAGCEISNINDTIHDIAFRETMLDLRKILNDEEIFREMKSRLGESNLKLLKENLEICANSRAYNSKIVQAEKLNNSILNWLRTMTINSSILGNIKTSLQNMGNIFLYANSVDGFGYADTLVAMKNAIPSHTEIDELCQKSAFMKERMIVPEYSLREINGRGDLNRAQKETLKWGAWMLSATDMATAKPVWAQAYSKKLNEGKSEKEAIEFADTIVRRTLGSSRIYDVASVRRGSDLFKLFTMFQGFFNTQFNQWEREMHVLPKMWKQGDKKDVLLRLTSFLAGKYLAVCLANIYLALDNPFEEDKDGYMNITKELANYPLSMGGPVGQAANVGVQMAMGMRNYGYRFTPVQSTIDNVYTIISLAHRVSTGASKGDDEQELAQRSFRMAANSFGVPSSPINLLYNLFDIGTDKMDFELQDLIKRRPRSEREKGN